MENELNISEKRAIKRSKISYMLECDFEYLVTLFVCDSILAMLLTKLGISDDKIGIISSLISFAFVFQLLAFVFVPIIKNTKVFASIVHGCSQLLFGLMFLLPFLPINIALKRVLVVVIILLAYLGNYSVNSLIYRWGNSYVEPNKRGIFSAKKEIISLISGAVIQLSSGFIIDYYVGLNDFNGCFLFIAISIFIFSLSDLICLILMKREKEEIINENTQENLSEEKESFIYVSKKLIKNKSFLKLTFLSVLYYIEMYGCVSFLGTYKNNDLLMSMVLVQSLNIFAVLSRAIVSIPLGKYADKHSYVKGTTLGFILTGISFVFLIFTAPKTWWLFIPFIGLYNIGLGALSGNLYNAIYDYVDEKHFSQAFALKASIAGIIGFLASLVGGFILKNIQENNNIIFGINIYGQQILAVISLLICIIAIMFNKKSLEKDERIKK